MTREVPFSFFDGRSFTLAGVDVTQTFGDADGVVFVLDGVRYAAVEDVDESSLRYILDLDAGPGVPADFIVSTPLPHVRVRGTLVKEDKREVLEFRDVDGHVWLEVGTDYSLDYYPLFVGDFHPKLSMPAEIGENLRK